MLRLSRWLLPGDLELERKLKRAPPDFDLDALQDECDGMPHTVGRRMFEERLQAVSDMSVAERLAPYNEKAFGDEMHRAKASKHRAVIAFLPKHWGPMLDAFRHACVYCRATGVKLALDHVIPMQDGGDHALWNVVPACQPCNSSKGAKDLEGWCAQQKRPLRDILKRIENGREILEIVLGDDVMHARYVG
jgi:hypothetical protein